MTETRIALDALRDDEPRRVDRPDGPLVLIRQGDRVSALAGRCPHAGAPLEQGAVCGGRLVCPWHMARFRVADGALIEPPALAPLARHAVRIEGNSVIVGDALAAAEDRVPGDDDAALAIVGTGAAASGALALLRTRGHRGRILLIGPETAPPYDRTVLSKMVIAGGMPPDPVPVLDAWPDRVERVAGEVSRLDPVARRITLSDGRTLGYDRALVATGGAPKRPGLPGADLAGVHVLRSADDAASLVRSIENARSAVVVGSGFIGLEVASGLRERGIAVTVIGRAPVPLAHVLGERIGRRLRALHESRGVIFRDTPVARFEGDARVERALLEDGRTIACDLVLLSVGIAPATGFIEGIERSEDGGVRVNDCLQAAPGLFAAGDIAVFPYDGAPVRIEHWRAAQEQGWLAARNMRGENAAYDGVPFFWTAQHGLRLDYLGHAAEWDETIIEGDLETLDFVAFLGRQRRLAAVIGCAQETRIARLAEAMRRPLTVDAARSV